MEKSVLRYALDNSLFGFFAESFDEEGSKLTVEYLN